MVGHASTLARPEVHSTTSDVYRQAGPKFLEAARGFMDRWGVSEARNPDHRDISWSRGSLAQALIKIMNHAPALPLSSSLS